MFLRGSGTLSANCAEMGDSTGAVLLEVVETPLTSQRQVTGLRSLGSTVDTCSATVLWRFGRISFVFYVKGVIQILRLLLLSTCSLEKCAQ